MPVLDAEKTVLESITAMYDVCFQAEKRYRISYWPIRDWL